MPEQPVPVPIYIGRHGYSVSGDLFHMTPEGEMTPIEARQLSNEMLRVSTQQGQVALMIDLSRMSKPSPETRRVIMQSIHELNVLGIGFYGAGLVLRTMLTLVNRGAAILKGREDPTCFCATESEALSWLNSLRASAVK
jgi:hypothetical protein